MDKLLAFITGGWGQLLGKGMMLATLVACAYLAISNHDNSVRKEQLDKDVIVQLDQVNKNNVELQRRLDALTEYNKTILAELSVKNNKVIETHDTVTKYITSPEGQKDNRESSPLLKETIRILRDGK